jgi:mannitol-specific phosphotransferase system IIBC component
MSMLTVLYSTSTTFTAPLSSTAAHARRLQGLVVNIQVWPGVFVGYLISAVVSAEAVQQELHRQHQRAEKWKGQCKRMRRELSAVHAAVAAQVRNVPQHIKIEALLCICVGHPFHGCTISNSCMNLSATARCGTAISCQSRCLQMVVPTHPCTAAARDHRLQGG